MKIKDKMSANVKMMLAIVNDVPDGQNLTTAQQAQYDKLQQTNNNYQALINDGTVTENDEADRPLIVSNRPSQSQPGAVPDDGRPAVKLPAQAKRYNLRSFKDPSVAYSFGRWMMAISGHAGSVGWCAEHGLNIYATSHDENTNTLGGYLVPSQFSNEIIDLRNDYGVFRKNARVIPMTSDNLLIPRRSTGLTGYWTGENSVITESSKTWSQVALTLKKLGVISRMSKELAEDAVIPVADDLADEIGYAFAYSEDVAGFTGTGLSTQGGITGLGLALNTAAGTPTTTTAGGCVVASDVHMASLVLGDLTALIGRVLPRALKRSKWYCSPVFYSDVMLRLLYGAGGLSASDITNGVQQSYVGYPVELTASMPSTDAASQILCFFGDLGLAATMGDRNGISLELSGSAVVGGESTFERDQVAIRGRERVDIVVHDVGNTVSGGPIVCLKSLNA